MEPEPAGNQNQKKGRTLTDLLIWLALVPFILGTLLCCGQLALLIIPGNPSVRTGSLLSAEYSAWPYENIAPIDVERFLRDVEKDQRLYESELPDETVIEGVYWKPPTPVVEIAFATPSVVVPSAEAPVKTTPTPAITTPLITPTRPLVTVTPRPSTTTSVSTITNTATQTLPSVVPPQPTSTFTEEPEEDTLTPSVTLPPTFTFTPTASSTATVTPSITFTATATSTSTSTPTSTATLTPTPTNTFTLTPTSSPTPTPTYAPVRPIVENNGVSEPMPGGGCRAFFGYRNDNPQEVDIPYGERNWIDDPVAAANPPQPTHYLIGREFRVFEFTWYTGMPLTWWLDSRTAVAAWCNPAP